MKRFKIENVFTIVALLGVLLLFGAFVFEGTNVRWALYAAISVFVGLAITIVIKHIHKSDRNFVANNVLSTSLCFVVCLILGSSFILNTSASFSFDAQNIANGYLTVNASSSDTSNSNSTVIVSGNTITVTAKGITTDGCNGGDSADTITLTIQNNKTAAVKYDLSLTNATASVDYVGTGKELAAGGSFQITVVSDAGASSDAVEGTIVFSNVSLVSTDAEVTTLFANTTRGDADDALAYSTTFGGTYTVDGTLITGNTSKTEKSSHSYALVATPANGYYFYGWMSKNDGLISTSSSYEYTAAEGSTDVIWPYFIKTGSATYYIKGISSVKYGYLDDAIVAAGSSGVIVVGESGTLAAGDYTIPSGVTLLIPFDSNNTLFTTAPGVVEADTENKVNVYGTPTIYRTLTMAQGAHITVSSTAAISLSAYQTSQMPYNGAPYGALSHIAMNTGSSITFESGSNLYCWGIISGTGTVSMKSGATVYQDFQAVGWRGGSYTSKIKENTQKVFPMNQYYFQNVQVPLTMHSGAVMNCQTSMDISIVGVQSPAFTLVGKDSGLFQINSGSVTFDYLEDQDRMNIIADGNVTMDSITISMKIGLVESVSINSASFVLPLMQNMSLVINGTVNVQYDMAMLPGTQLEIAESGVVNINNGANIYVYDKDQWGGYCGSKDKTFMAVPWAYNKTYTRTDADLVDAHIVVNGKLDASAGFVYTTQSGASITSEGAGELVLNPGTNTETYQTVQASESFTSIPVTPAQLLNGDGSGYVATTTAGTYVYHAEHKRWVLNAHAANGTGCNHAKTWTVCTCGVTYGELARKYNVYVTDYQGNKTLLGNLAYGTAPSLTLKDTESNCFVISHTGWSYSGTTFAAASGFWALVTDANVTASTTDLTIEGQYTPTAIKSGAITMTVNYSNLPADTAMQVIFFVPVDTESTTAPSVLLNDVTDGVTVKKVDNVLMYQVTVNLSAEQIAEKPEGDKSGNATIEITYPDVNLTKELDSVLLAYAKALQSQLTSSAMGSQANAMEAVLDYGAAVQIYFNTGNSFEFAGYTDDEIANYAINSTIDSSTLSKTENGVTFTWSSANVNFRTEYNMRYYFTLANLPEGVTIDSAVLTVKYADADKASQEYNVSVETSGSRYRVTYPVPASDLSQAGTKVQLTLTLSDGKTTVTSSEFAYGINAYLTRSIHRYTAGNALVDGDAAKTKKYVNMLVSLVKLGEAVSEIEGTTN